MRRNEARLNISTFQGETNGVAVRPKFAVRSHSRLKIAFPFSKIQNCIVIGFRSQSVRPPGCCDAYWDGLISIVLRTKQTRMDVHRMR